MAIKKRPSPKTLEEKRRREWEKYQKIYSRLSKNGMSGFARYGRGNHWKDAMPRIKAMRIDSVVDVGTGKGDFPKQMFKLGCRLCYGYDFAMQPEDEIRSQYPDKVLVIKRASAHELPHDDKSIEYVTAFDMLEHLVPEDVPIVLREFARVAVRGLIFSIGYKPSILKVDGQTLHPTVRDKRWWIDTIAEVTGASCREYNQYLFFTLR